MPHFAILSGNVFRCVVGDNPHSACVNATTMHCREAERDEIEMASPSPIFEVHELGKPGGETVIIPSDEIRDLGNFQSFEVEEEIDWSVEPDEEDEDA